MMLSLMAISISMPIPWDENTNLFVVMERDLYEDMQLIRGYYSDEYKNGEPSPSPTFDDTDFESNSFSPAPPPPLTQPYYKDEDPSPSPTFDSSLSSYKWIHWIHFAKDLERGDEYSRKSDTMSGWEEYEYDDYVIDGVDR